MPNNVFNRLELKGKPALVREILEAIQDDELGPGLIDEGSVTHTGYEAVRDFLGRHPGIQKDELLSMAADAARTLDPKLTVQHEQTWELGKKRISISWNTGTPAGTAGASSIGEPSGMPMTRQ